MKISKADGTVIVNAFVHTFVIVLIGLVHAAAAVVAMVKVFFASNSTYSALIAVIYPFLITKIVVQIADLAEIFSEFLLTANALPALRLFKPTTQTLYVGDSFAIELVVFLRIHFLFMTYLVVAKPARPKFTLADGIRTLLLAGSFVVFAAQFALVGFELNRCVRVLFKF